MPDGQTHLKIWTAAWSVALPVAALTLIAGEPVIAAGITIGYGLGRYLDPDLDVMGTAGGDGRMVNELPIVGLLLYGYWSVYGAVFRRHHRSKWTHGPFISTAIRFVYQFWLPALAIYYYHMNWAWWLLLGMYGGLTFADVLHWAADTLSGELRRSKR